MFTYVHIFLVLWDVLGRRRWQFQLSSLQWIPSEHPWLSFHVFRPQEMSCFQTSSDNRVIQTYLGITCDFYLRSDAICEKANVWHGMSIFSKFHLPGAKKKGKVTQLLSWMNTRMSWNLLGTTPTRPTRSPRPYDFPCRLLKRVSTSPIYWRYGLVATVCVCSVHTICICNICTCHYSFKLIVWVLF